MPKILVLGAGFVAGPLIDYLHRDPENHLTVASEHLRDAEQRAAGRERIHAKEIRVAQTSDFAALIASHDLVISLLPYTLHPIVAEVCLSTGRHLVTTSYESEAMRSFDAEAKACGLTFLNEIGLDPGIDHLGAMTVIDEVRSTGGEIESFVSWCGGIPAPECNDNPLGYKFAWAPIGALLALLNDACYREQGRDVQISQHALLQTISSIKIDDHLQLEGYPNRNSLAYADVYKIHHAKQILRGTLRYPGYAAIMHAIKELGLLSTESDPLLQENAAAIRWKQLLASRLNTTEVDLLAKLPFDKSVVEGLRWLELLGDAYAPRLGNRLDALCEWLKPRLSYQPNERDMVVLQHRFGILTADGERTQRLDTLIAYGTPGGYSAMAKTVGTPAAVAAQLILDGALQRRGVILPVTDDIYRPILRLLAEEGICFETTLV